VVDTQRTVFFLHIWPTMHCELVSLCRNRRGAPGLCERARPLCPSPFGYGLAGRSANSI